MPRLCEKRRGCRLAGKSLHQLKEAVWACRLKKRLKLHNGSVAVCPEIIGKGSKYINTAVLFPIVRINGEDQILFEKRSSNIPQANEICLPAGRIDKSIDATPQQAAIRETCEELGIDRAKIRIIEYLGTIVAPLGVAVDTFIAEIEINSLSDIKYNVAEVHSVFSIPIQWFQSQEPKEYHVRLEIHPFHVGGSGEAEYYLPVRAKASVVCRVVKGAFA